MSAGRSERTPSEPPDNSARSVHKFGSDNPADWSDAEAIVSLSRLAPLHQAAAIRRALRAVGGAFDASGPVPCLDHLIAAADEEPSIPATPTWTALTGDRLAAWAVTKFIDDPRFNEGEEFDFGRACRVAEEIVGTAAADRTWTAYRDGLTRYRHAVAWRTAWAAPAAWLAAFARRMAPHVPDSALAAMPEAEMRDLAATRADIEKQRIRAWRKDEMDATGRARELSPTERRLMCPLWWRRQMRRRAADARQFWAGALGTCGGTGGVRYADDYSLARWQERQEAARVFGETHVIRAADGTQVPMWQVMQSSAAAALNRLYVQTVGIEEVARRLGLVPLFMTLTLPREWHPRSDAWTPDRTPARADKELSRLWNLFGAHLAGDGIKLLGMRVYEGHGSGVPHAHALLYVRPDQVEQVDAALQAVRPELPEHQRQKTRVATKLIRIDASKASAASYVLKYVLKSLNVSATGAMASKGVDAAAKLAVAAAVEKLADDQEDEEDEEDEGTANERGRHVEAHDRHRAWASERRIRRYAMLGTHGIQRVWQRIFTLKECPSEAPPHVQRAWRAMHAERDEPPGRDAPQADRLAYRRRQGRRWGSVILALRGIAGGQRGRVRLTYDQVATAYGDARRKPDGILDEATGWTMPLQAQEWTIEHVKPPPNPEGRADWKPAPAYNGPIIGVAVSDPRAGASAPAEPTERLFISDEGIVFDLDTGEIVDEVDWGPPPALLVPVCNDDFVDDGDMDLAA